MRKEEERMSESSELTPIKAGDVIELKSGKKYPVRGFSVEGQKGRGMYYGMTGWMDLLIDGDKIVGVTRNGRAL